MPDPPPQLFEKTVSRGGQSRLLGEWGERLVAEDLVRKGWRLLAANYRSRFGEVDLIVSDDRYISFVEVKLRGTARFGRAMEAVGTEKQRKLRATAQLYLMEHPTNLQPRFDVVEVYAPQGIHTPKPDIFYIINAF